MIHIRLEEPGEKVSLTKTDKKVTWSKKRLIKWIAYGNMILLAIILQMTMAGALSWQRLAKVIALFWLSYPLFILLLWAQVRLVSKLMQRRMANKRGL